MRKEFLKIATSFLGIGLVLFLVQILHVNTLIPNTSENQALIAGIVVAPENMLNLFDSHTAIGAMIFAGFGITFGLIGLGSKKIKLHNSYLEQQVKDRTQNLEQKHRELIKQNAAYKEALSLIKEQKEEIETAQHDLLTKNKDLHEALEEISAQNELIDEERSKLNQAKKIIQTQNTKLLNIARSLDQQVQQRTAELSVANNLLLEKNQELDDFIYKSAHDLRGPIARFKGLSNLINIEYKLGNDISAHLSHLHQSANQMDSMLKRLSNVYEISARPVSVQKIGLDDVLASVFDRLKREEISEHLELQINNEVEKPLLIDPTMLHLILKNLIGNSMRFYDPLKLKKWIKIDCRIEDKNLIVQVTDNGIGIKKEQQQKIFDLFYVGSDLHKGPGLGLYICKIISKKLNGNIKLNYSHPEKETAFQAVFPL